MFRLDTRLRISFARGFDSRCLHQHLWGTDAQGAAEGTTCSSCATLFAKAFRHSFTFQDSSPSASFSNTHTHNLQLECCSLLSGPRPVGDFPIDVATCCEARPVSRGWVLGMGTSGTPKVPQSRASWSPLDGSWCIFNGSGGVLLVLVLQASCSTGASGLRAEISEQHLMLRTSIWTMAGSR